MQGADTVIYERLDPSSQQNKQLKAPTRAHMEEFGAAGLRTLCLSYTELNRDEYDRYALTISNAAQFKISLRFADLPCCVHGWTASNSNRSFGMVALTHQASYPFNCVNV